MQSPTSTPPLPLIHLIATGGTIAMKRPLDGGAPVPAISGEDLLSAIPGLPQVARVQVSNPFNIPSGYMDPSLWRILLESVQNAVNNEECQGVVVSHGTDTLEETAWFLDLTTNTDKPIILVGAQRNASDWDSDGPRNILNSIRVAANPQSQGKGVLVVMNGRIHAAREVFKSHTAAVEAFQSGEFGALGSTDDDRVIFARSPLRRQHIALQEKELPRVEIIPMYAGADGLMLRQAVAHGAKGLVIAALGFGNVNIALYEAIRYAISQGITVAITSRIAHGRVLPHYGYTGGGKTLQDLGCLFADNLSPWKARVLLMLALQASDSGHGPSSANIQALFD